MMMMKFKFNEVKCKQILGLPANACYLKIDQVLAKDGIYPVKRGIYFATEKEGFYPFGMLRCKLPDTDWFMKVIEEWYWLDDIDYMENIERYNCLNSYKKYGA
jgi:hypothetical protein